MPDLPAILAAIRGEEPSFTPGLRLRSMAPGDPVAFGRACLQCGKGYADNPLVLEPHDQSFSLHVSCVLTLAAAVLGIASEQTADTRNELEALIERYN